MASIVSGFEFDIFISYRHNDNLDGWVTEFVQNLEKEMRSTLKDSLTTYFDKDPHDGLLETHHVDKSLEGKLKCLIFIPIISQTYCDPKSFAWQQEFCAFNKKSKEDPFGREVKLSNGNVASRLLPVKIHDLDADDKVTIENELGGVLRAIEFIYKEPGVNRPLSIEDNDSKNLNKTKYKNQVNKVANLYASDHQFEKGKEMINKAIEIDPDYAYGYSQLAYLNIREGDFDSALENIKRAGELDPDFTMRLATIVTLIKANRVEDAQEFYKSHGAPPVGIAVNYANEAKIEFWMGHFDKGFELLELALAEKNYDVLTIRYAPSYEVVRKHPRYKEFLKKIPFPPDN